MPIDDQVRKMHSDNKLRMLEVTRVCRNRNGRDYWTKSDGKVYRTADCTVLASHLEWPGTKWWLLRMPDGTYIDQWQSVDPEGIGDHITIRTTTDAMSIFTGMRKKYAEWEKQHVTWEEAFPGMRRLTQGASAQHAATDGHDKRSDEGASGNQRHRRDA